MSQTLERYYSELAAVKKRYVKAVHKLTDLGAVCEEQQKNNPKVKYFEQQLQIQEEKLQKIEEDEITLDETPMSSKIQAIEEDFDAKVKVALAKFKAAQDELEARKKAAIDHVVNMYTTRKKKHIESDKEKVQKAINFYKKQLETCSGSEPASKEYLMAKQERDRAKEEYDELGRQIDTEERIAKQLREAETRQKLMEERQEEARKNEELLQKIAMEKEREERAQLERRKDSVANYWRNLSKEDFQEAYKEIEDKEGYIEMIPAEFRSKFKTWIPDAR